MKEELQGKLVEILISIQTAAGKASDFAMAELPDIAQSYIAYGRASLSAAVLFGLLICLGGFYAVHRVNLRHAAATRQFEKDLAAHKEGGGRGMEPYRSRYFESQDIMPAQFFPFIIGGVLVACTINQFLLVWFAPKVWLLKEIAGMLR